MGELAKYDAARHALSVAVQIDEVKDIRDKAQAMAAYARQARDTEMVQWATEIKVRAERRAGQMLAELPKAKGEILRGHTMGPRENDVKTLADMGITKNESARWQKLAAVNEAQFEQAISAAKEVAGEVTTAAMVRATTPEKPIEVTAAPEPDAEQAQDDYTEIDALRDEIEELQAQLVVARMSSLNTEEQKQATALIAELRGELKTINAVLKSVKTSRDGFQNQVADMQSQINRQRREIDKLTGKKTA